MARSDLLIALVKAGSAGDKSAVRDAAEKIIADERSKQHTVLADRLSRAIQTNGNGTHLMMPSTELSNRGREFLAEVNPVRRLDDLVLSSHCRQAVEQLVEEQRRASLLRAHGLDPRHRVLLVGPPGNGKTSLAEAIAELLAVPMLVVRYESLIGSFLGETASRLKRVFDYARTLPCVLFFDEFDAVGKERGDIHETGEIKRVVTSLLMQVDGLPSYTVIVAATNHAELLDRAVWRRFQLRLTLAAPTAKELSEYFERSLRTFEEKTGVSGAYLAKRLGSISYAEAEQFIQDVRRRWILSLKQDALKTFIESQLLLWEHRTQPAPTPNKAARNKATLNGKPSPTRPPSAK